MARIPCWKLVVNVVDRLCTVQYGPANSSMWKAHLQLSHATRAREVLSGFRGIGVLHASQLSLLRLGFVLRFLAMGNGDGTSERSRDTRALGGEAGAAHAPLRYCCLPFESWHAIGGSSFSSLMASSSSSYYAQWGATRPIIRLAMLSGVLRALFYASLRSARSRVGLTVSPRQTCDTS